MTRWPYAVFIALRYVRGGRARSISFISLISAIGIVVGIATLITACSVFNGFEREVRARVLGAVSHAVVTHASDGFHDWQAVAARLADHPDVVAAAPYILETGMVARGKTVRGVAVRGVLPQAESHVSDFEAAMQSGRLEALQAGASGLVVGSAIAEALNLRVGSPVALVVPQHQSGIDAMPRFKTFTVVGIFKMDMYEYDNGLVMMHLGDAADLYRMPGAVSGLRLKLADLDRARTIAAQIGATLGVDYRVRDWTREHGAYFKAVQMQKTVVFLILLLIVAVAMFNVVSTLVVLVNEKRADIAILRTLGAGNAGIMAVFVIYGGLLGMLGTLLGTGLGVALALNIEAMVQAFEAFFNTSLLAADVYFISQVPSDLRWSDVALITGSAMALALLSAIYPAKRAVSVQPAAALRYE